MKKEDQEIIVLAKRLVKLFEDRGVKEDHINNNILAISINRFEGRDFHIGSITQHIMVTTHDMKRLEDLTQEEYSQLLKSGMFWELYPQATGIYSQDCEKGEQDTFSKVEESDI